MSNKKSTALLKAAKIFSLLLILGVFLFLFVFCVFLPRTTVSDYDTLTPFPTFSFSSLFDGSYTAQLSEWFTDTLHNRDKMKESYAELNSYFGKETVTFTDDGVREELIGSISIPEDIVSNSSSDSSVTVSFAGGDSSAEDNSTVSADTSANTSSVTDTSSEETSDNTSKAPENDKEIEAGSILLLGTRAMEIYYGDPNLNRIPRFASALNSFAAKNPNVNVYSMVVPKAAAFYLGASKNYGYLANRTINDLNAIEEHLSENVTSINIYNTLSQHADEAIYARTDHHWTSLGAYYAAEEFAKQLGLPFASLSEYNKKIRTGYLGTMYKYSDYSTVLRDNPEDFVTYEPTVSYTATFYDQKFQNPFNRGSMFFTVGDDAKSSWYLTFIGGDSYSVKLESGVCSNGRKLLVVKDSYGNALAPYLLNSFETVYFVDARYFEINLNTFVKQEGITDVLFAEVAFSAVSDSYIDYLEDLTR